jgi:poly(A) polymerase
MELLGIKPGPIVGQALSMLLEARLDEGPLGEAEAERRLLAWWADHAGPGRRPRDEPPGPGRDRP